MSYVLMSESRPKAKVKHLCIWCGQHIVVGERYRHEKSIYDGHFQNHKWHLECEKACDEENCGVGEYEIFPYDNERPSERLGWENAAGDVRREPAPPQQ